MAKRRIDMYQYRQIIVRLRMGTSTRSIAKAGLVSRSKVKSIHQIASQQGWLDVKNELPSDDVMAIHFKSLSTSPITQSSILPYQKQVETWYQQGIQGSVIYATLQRQHGFKGAYDSVQRFIKKLKDISPEVSMILDFKPGECAQVDFGAGPPLIDALTGEITKTWIFVMVLAWSRHQYAEIVLNQNVETWLGCHRRTFEWFNGVPKKIIIDNPKCAITKACYYDPVVQRSYAECAEGYGFIISPCAPRPFLKPLPDQPPECVVWEKVTLHGDCHVMFLKCRYSAPYKLVRQLLWLRSSETTVRIYQDHTLVAVHPRLFKPGSRHTLEEHLPPNAIAYCMQDSQWCLGHAKKIGAHCEKVIQKLLNDSVVDYLRAAQGIVGLQKSYGNARLDAACKRAIVFQSTHYQTIKSILKKGLEYKPLPEQEAFDALTETYTGGGRFSRNTSTLLQ